MVTGATDINTGPRLGRTTDLDVALSSMGTDDTMTPGGRAGHPDLHVCSDCTVFGHSHDHRWWPSPWASVWPLVATQAMDITDTSSCGTMDPDMGHKSPWSRVAAQGTHISLLFSASASTDPPLSTACELLASLPLPFLHHVCSLQWCPLEAPDGPVGVFHPPGRAAQGCLHS